MNTLEFMPMFWTAIEALLGPDGPDASGWAAIGWSEGQDGRVRVVHVKGRREVKDGWRAPTLLIDATLQVPLVRPFWPNVKLVADIAVARWSIAAFPSATWNCMTT